MKRIHASPLGGMLRTARMAQGLSLRDLARQTRIPLSWLARTERGDYTRPAPRRLAQLADVLRIELREINQATGGGIADALPAAPVYFRAKYDLSPSEIARVEQVLAEVRRERAANQEPEH